MRIILSNNAPVAQGIEQLPSKQWVRGSIPRGRAIIIFFILNVFFLTYSSASSTKAPLELFLGGNEKEAINIWKQYSEMGNLDATYALGIVFYDSDVTGLCQRIEDSNCKNNFKSGLKYYKIAHDAGDVRATYALGEHYDYFRKFKKAFRFYLTAAEAGVPEAQFNTASMYEHGEGVTQDIVQAVRWYLQCNETKLCLQKEDGISDLIEQLTIDELQFAKSFLIIDQVPINIRLDSVAKSK